MRYKVLQRLHQTPLHVTSLGCLDGSIDQTFTARDSVEEELCGSESGVEGVAHETLSWRFSGFLGEMWERAVLEPIWYTMAGDDLLPDTSNHLGHVDDGT